MIANCFSEKRRKLGLITDDANKNYELYVSPVELKLADDTTTIKYSNFIVTVPGNNSVRDNKVGMLIHYNNSTYFNSYRYL